MNWTIRRLKPSDRPYVKWMWPDRWLARKGSTYFTAITESGVVRRVNRYEAAEDRAERTKREI